MFEIDWSKIFTVAMGYGVKILCLIIAFAILAPIAKKLVTAMIRKTTSKQKVSKARAATLEKLILSVFSYTVIFIFIVMFFGIIDQPIGPLLASAGVIGLAIAFGAQGLVSDIVTGFFILLEKQIEVDDYVTVAGYDGVVEEIGLRTTQLRGFDGTLYFVPNREISGVSNHSRGNMRALVDIGISYDDSIDQAILVLQEICKDFQDDNRFVEGPDVLGVQAFGTGEVVLRMIGKTINGEQFGAERDLRKRIKDVFDQKNITIPYPHQVYISK